MCVAGAAGHGRLHDERVAVGGRHRVDDRVDRGEVGVARVGGRRADGDEQQPRVLQRVREVRREVQAVAVALDELRKPRLPDRDPALLEALDLRRVDVDAVDVGAQLGESGRRDEADVPGPDDADRLPCVRAHWTDHPSELRGGDGLLLAEPPQRGGDPDHLVLAQRLGERVGDPVDGALRPPRDEPQPAAVVVQLELAAVDPAGLRRVVEDRRARARSCPGCRSTRRRRPWRPRAGTRGASCRARPRSCRSAARCRRSASRCSAASGSRTGSARGGRRRSPGPRPRGARPRARARRRRLLRLPLRAEADLRSARRGARGRCAASSTPSR